MMTTRFVAASGRRGMRCLLAVTAVLLAASGMAMATGSSAAVASPAASPPPVTVKPCAGKKVTGPFVARGAQVYSGEGAGPPFLSYGPTIAFTLDGKAWNSGTTVAGDMDEQEIAWAADYWCANTVRLQVNQDLLINRDFTINHSYLNAIEAEVQDAVNHGLVVVLNDSTESSVYGDIELYPNLYTYYFWKVLAGLYGHGRSNLYHINGPQHVIFDLFNEPRYSDPSFPEWYYGPVGIVAPIPYLYLGMEPLARAVRELAPHTLFWIEGPQYSDSFAGMYPDYMITVKNVVYAIHHPAPGSNAKTPDDPQAWDRDFGYLAEKKIAPVVVGEWTNHELGGSYNSACWTDAKTQVKVFLNDYLTGHHIGLSAYTLNSGYLLRTIWSAGKKPVALPPNPLQPTTINANWTCKPVTKPPAAGEQGAGLYVYDFFKARNAA
jgi:hypothetical protein